jgi:uncharacterized hydrophobic protein (TIGR00271 family)
MVALRKNTVMKTNPLDIFSLHYEKEDFHTVISGIENGVSFRGTNLWILIFAILVASLGLNVNSTAVIIGAMLISPLMGPIMGIGLSIGINDPRLLRRAVSNYLVATIVALATSTLFFLVSPLNDAHSEILARTSPNIYDVLIALFGGFAGIIATSTRQKGNVIPGVAIATALMPPLCTAGYGLATMRMNYFVGAFYLYIINTVFIGLATLLIVRLLHFPHVQQQETRQGILARRIAWAVVIATLIPSIYFGYDLVQQTRFEKDANRFISAEAQFRDDYLLNKKISARDRTISLTYGGKKILPEEIEQLRRKLAGYGLQDAGLDIRQGFAYLTEDKKGGPDPQLVQLTAALEEKQKQSDSLYRIRQLSQDVFAELRTQYPGTRSAIIEPVSERTDSSAHEGYLVWISANRRFSGDERTRLESWLKLRLRQPQVKLIIQP